MDLQSMLLELAKGYELKGQKERCLLATMPREIMPLIGKCLTEAWNEQQERNGFVTPPSSPVRRHNCPVSYAKGDISIENMSTIWMLHTGPCICDAGRVPGFALAADAKL